MHIHLKIKTFLLRVDDLTQSTTLMTKCTHWTESTHSPTYIHIYMPWSQQLDKMTAGCGIRDKHV